MCFACFFSPCVQPRLSFNGISAGYLGVYQIIDDNRHMNDKIKQPFLNHLFIKRVIH